MRNIDNILIACAIISTMVFTSCDSQLDLTPNSQLAAEDALNGLADLDAALTGAYAGMQSRNYYGRDFVGFAHMTSDNAIIPEGAGSFLNFEPFYQMTYTPANGATGAWAQMYDVIARVNNVINSIDGVEGAQGEKNRIKGEALFIRALAHHDLLRLFAQDYNFTADAGHLGVPYIFVTEIGSPSRNTVSECYQFILDDLSTAINLMGSGNERVALDAPSFGSIWAAKAVKARVHLYMSDYSQALAEADDVINNGGFVLAPYKVDDGTGGVDLTQIDSWSSRAPTSESIFELEFDEQDGLWTTLSLARLFKPQPNGLGEGGPNQDIVDLYSPSDVRQNWFIQDGGQNFVNKYPDNDGVNLNFTVPIVRLTELYLIKAESHVMLNQPAQARDAINAVTLRANAPLITSDGSQLVSDILEERRRELAFEGHRFFDIKRLQQDIVRNDCSLQNNCMVAYGDRLFAYPIPQEEVDANPNMQQNSGY